MPIAARPVRARCSGKFWWRVREGFGGGDVVDSDKCARSYRRQTGSQAPPTTIRALRSLVGELRGDARYAPRCTAWLAGDLTAGSKGEGNEALGKRVWARGAGVDNRLVAIECARFVADADRIVVRCRTHAPAAVA